MNFYSFSKKSRATREFVLSLLLLMCAAIGLSGCKGRGSVLADTPTNRVPDAPPQNSYAAVVRRVAPAVVTIRSNKRVRAPEQFPFADDPFFRGLFGNRGQQPPQESLQRGLGSGVIVNPDGYILTNHHVIDGAEEIKVDLNDGRTLDAKVIGSDSPSDLAVLKISASGLPYMTPGDSDKVQVGDIALAIGNPLGIGQTVTMGIISAKGRSGPGLGSGTFEDFLQTDAPINQGNSGGALVNTNGEFIGVNSQILSSGGGNIGIGFAIPSNMARSVMDQLVKDGKVRRGQLGITVSRVTSDLAQSLGMSEAKGVIVNSVRPGSAAERAGIRQGDVITAINDTSVNDTNAFRNRVASNPPGAQVTLTILRGNREQKIQATLGEFSAENAQAEQRDSNGQTAQGEGKLGLSVEPLTPDIVSELKLKAGTQGVVVDSVDLTGPAAVAGIQSGDVIQEVNHQTVRSADDLRNALAKTGSGPALFLINRRGETVFLAIRPRG